MFKKHLWVATWFIHQQSTSLHDCMIAWWKIVCKLIVVSLMSAMIHVCHLSSRRSGRIFATFGFDCAEKQNLVHICISLEPANPQQVNVQRKTTKQNVCTLMTPKMFISMVEAQSLQNAWVLCSVSERWLMASEWHRPGGHCRMHGLAFQTDDWWENKFSSLPLREENVLSRSLWSQKMHVSASRCLALPNFNMLHIIWLMMRSSDCWFSVSSYSSLLHAHHPHHVTQEGHVMCSPLMICCTNDSTFTFSLSSHRNSWDVCDAQSTMMLGQCFALQTNENDNSLATIYQESKSTQLNLAAFVTSHLSKHLPAVPSMKPTCCCGRFAWWLVSEMWPWSLWFKVIGTGLHEYGTWSFAPAFELSARQLQPPEKRHLMDASGQQNPINFYSIGHQTGPKTKTSARIKRGCCHPGFSLCAQLCTLNSSHWKCLQQICLIEQLTNLRWH